MISDFRKQKRIIRIELESSYDYSLDDFVDKLIKDIKIVCEQREKKEIGIEITIE